jgi:hypothetical protein
VRDIIDVGRARTDDDPRSRLRLPPRRRRAAPPLGDPVAALRRGLDVTAYRAKFGADPLEHFPQLDELAPRGLAQRSDDVLALTHAGLARADAIGPWLYSDAVRTRMAEYELS